ncbi:MAG: 4-hydroxy-tetrahydrodipicolinate synthase [Candidatus Latescibacteria bacterium]|jgi:4-hydroxy-tetrahydrodipicolinate synthase|nr:4-hydroxy-tetrahydrodipicolinate synthase [Candidatus Latescibacterota bacterium]
MLKLEGTFTAIVTPFSDGRVDRAKLSEMVDFQIENGISGLIPVGTTGESPTLSHEEHMTVIDNVIEAANGRVPVIAGTGSNNTTEAVNLTKHAIESGADAALLITPYYNRPSQAGLIQHYRTIADCCDIPLIIYNCPGRTAVNTTSDTIVELAECPTIIGAKEASGSMDQICDILVRTPDDFTVLSGDDSMTLPMMSVGAKGVISVISNITPGKMVEMTSASLRGDFQTAREIHSELFPLMRLLMKTETNPSPIKAAMNIAGMNIGSVRLPLLEPNDEGKALIKKQLILLGIING